MIFFRDLVVVPQHRRERWLENFFFLSFFSSFRFLLQCHATRLVNRNGIEIGLRREIYRTGASSRAAESYWSLRWARSPSNRIDLYLYILSFASFHSPFKKKKILWGEPQYHFVYNHRTQRGREEMGSMSGTGDDRFSFFFFSILLSFLSIFFSSSSIYVISNNNEALVNISVCCVSNSREREQQKKKWKDQTERRDNHQETLSTRLSRSGSSTTFGRARTTKKAAAAGQRSIFPPEPHGLAWLWLARPHFTWQPASGSAKNPG